MKYLSIILAFLFLIPLTVSAEDKQIFINEFSIEPVQKVEILNSSNTDIDISGWFIDDNGGSVYFTIPENTIVSTQKCIVFEGIFNLNKTSPDTVQLFDSTANPPNENANLVDSYTYPQSPGDGKSYLRIPDGADSWEINSSSFGKNNVNGESCEVIIPTSTPTVSPTPKTTPTSAPTSFPQEYSNIYLSEVMVAPSMGESEWLEIYNNNPFTVNLINWVIDDITDGGASPLKFNLTINAYSYGSIEFVPRFNNDGDTVNLLDHQGTLVGSFSYSQSASGRSYGSKSLLSQLFCQQIPTKNFINSTCVKESTKIMPTKTPSSTSTPTQIISKGQPLSTISIKKSDNTSLSNYSRIVTPPAITSLQSYASTISTDNETNKSIPIEKSNSLSLLAVGYSTLSILSIGIKVSLSTILTS